MAHSYAYLARKAGIAPPNGLLPATTSNEPPRYARFYMPAIADLDEPAETRLVGFRSYRDTDWIEELSGNYYAFTRGQQLTTFFPDHP